MRKRFVFNALLVVLACSAFDAAALPRAKQSFVATGETINSSYAKQAAAADERFVYAVSSTTIAKIDRATGKEVGKSTDDAHHLNSGFCYEGKIYCAHSNYPKKPDESDIRVLDPESMKLTVFHAFDTPPGSLTWAIKRQGDWWCHFAHYGKENAKSVLVRFDREWKEIGRWTYPPELVAEWGNYSLSGGIWRGDELLTTGHDKKLIYRLRVPEKNGVVEVVEAIASPLPGQGIAADPKTGGLVGISRDGGKVQFVQRK